MYQTNKATNYLFVGLHFTFRNFKAWRLEKEINIGLQFLVRGLSISHEIRMKSGGFHVKSTQTEEFLLKHLNL